MHVIEKFTATIFANDGIVSCFEWIDQMPMPVTELIQTNNWIVFCFFFYTNVNLWKITANSIRCPRGSTTIDAPVQDQMQCSPLEWGLALSTLVVQRWPTKESKCFRSVSFLFGKNTQKLSNRLPPHGFDEILASPWICRETVQRPMECSCL